VLVVVVVEMSMI